MANDKKYYYLKLKDNFFDSEEMIILENMQDGYLYSNILLKLYLRSLKSEGKLMFRDIIPYSPEVLAQITRHHAGTIEKALKIFNQLGLIEILDDGAIYMLDIQNFIGQSSTEADRQRIYYHNIGKHKEIASKKPCKKSNKVSTPELELELDIEKELYLRVFENWNTLKNTQKHRKLTEKMKTAIKKAIHEYEATEEELTECAIRYDEFYDLCRKHWEEKLHIKKRGLISFYGQKTGQEKTDHLLFAEYLEGEKKANSLIDLREKEAKAEDESAPRFSNPKNKLKSWEELTSD